MRDGIAAQFRAQCVKGAIIRRSCVTHSGDGRCTLYHDDEHQHAPLLRSTAHRHSVPDCIRIAHIILHGDAPLKNLLITLALAVGIAALQFSGCLSTPRHAAPSHTDLQEVAFSDPATGSGQDARQDSLRLFRKEANARISGYDKTIASLKTKIAEEKSENRARYEKRLAEVETLNREAKAKLRAYTKDGKEAWADFREAFTREMDALGNSISNVFADDTK